METMMPRKNPRPQARRKLADLRLKIALKPCPFCGSSHVTIHEIEEEPGAWCATCESCMACSPVRIAVKEDVRSLVAEAWNRRTETERERVIREALEEIKTRAEAGDNSNVGFRGWAYSVAREALSKAAPASKRPIEG
jgi:Lar family restriction alleviation protein